MSTAEFEQLSEFYKSKYVELRYVEHKVRCTLDYEELAVKNIDVCYNDYVKMCMINFTLILLKTEDYNRVLETDAEKVHV